MARAFQLLCGTIDAASNPLGIVPITLAFELLKQQAMRRHPLLVLFLLSQAAIAAEPHTNSAGQVMLPIAPGSFIMGSPKTELGRSRDEDQVKAEITEPFYLCDTEVTQGQWLKLMETTMVDLVSSRKGAIGRGANLVSDASAEGPDQPMVFVNWIDAMAYCEKLTDTERKAGTLPEGHVYRLPTEAQWEYACRAGTDSVFSHGDTLTSEQANFYGVKPYGVEGAGEYREKTTKVKTFKPNPWGLHDMHGNVYEWCFDWYAEKAPGGKDPNVSEKSDGRNIRGGTWNRGASSCRSAYRYSSIPDRRTYNIGFRVALVKAE